MRVVSGVLCFIVMVLLNPIESMLSFLKKRPLLLSEISKIELEHLPKLSATVYMKNAGEKEVLRSMKPGPVYLEIMKKDGVEYVIGYVEDARQKDCPLDPFVIPSPTSIHQYIRIIIRVEANYAEKYIPLDENDPLNTAFFKPHNPHSIRLFNIEAKASRRPLVPFKPRHLTRPAATNQASSSRVLPSVREGGHLLDLGPPSILDVTGDQVKSWRQPAKYATKH